MVYPWPNEGEGITCSREESCELLWLIQQLGVGVVSRNRNLLGALTALSTFGEGVWEDKKKGQGWLQVCGMNK